MLKEFFLDQKNGISFTLFGGTHFSLLIALILIWFLMYIYKDKLSAINKDTKRLISLVLILILFMNMAIYYGGLIYYGVYNWETNLPLHFCFIAGYLFMYTVLFNKPKLYKIVYFMAFVGPIPAIVLPDLKSSFDAFLFYQQVISHHFFLLSSLFIFYAYQIKITKKDLAKSIVLSVSIFMSMLIFNNVFGTNYIMQNTLPEHVIKTLPFIKNINFPIFWLVSTGMIMLIIAYAPIWLEKDKYKNSLLKAESLL